jgi:hypothetical protein
LPSTLSVSPLPQVFLTTGGGAGIGEQTPLVSRNWPGPQAGGPVLQDFPSAPT